MYKTTLLTILVGKKNVTTQTESAQWNSDFGFDCCDIYKCIYMYKTTLTYQIILVGGKIKVTTTTNKTESASFIVVGGIVEKQQAEADSCTLKIYRFTFFGSPPSTRHRVLSQHTHTHIRAIQDHSSFHISHTHTQIIIDSDFEFLPKERTSRFHQVLLEISITKNDACHEQAS